MKKLLSVLVIMILTVSVLSGCGSKADMSDSEYLGTWEAVTCSYSDYVMDASEILGQYIITLRPDGSYEATFGEDVGEGTWEDTQNGFMLDGDEELSFVDGADGITLDYEGITIHFESR